MDAVSGISAGGTKAASEQALSFQLVGETCCADLLQVRETHRCSPVTSLPASLPRMPGHPNTQYLIGRSLSEAPTAMTH